jgi:IclR family pca regulon transcriptional regulator
MSIGLGVGSRLPAYCTSLGRAILAYQPEDALGAYVERVRLEPRTPKTVTGKAAFRAILEATRAQGYALVNEELEFGLRSIAVPVVEKNGRVTIALNLSAQAGRVSAEEMKERFLPALKAAGEALGYLL